jgi:hypothetical protein
LDCPNLALDATISTMSMVGMGFMGLAAGASTAGILGLVRLMTDTWFPWLNAHTEHRHHMLLSLFSQRAEEVRRWREGLAGARDAYRQWAAGPRTGDPPNIVGDAWFEGLRPNLPTVGAAAKYRTAHEISCDNPTVALLSLEIGRVEQLWTDEAKSNRRRAQS